MSNQLYLMEEDCSGERCRKCKKRMYDRFVYSITYVYRCNRCDTLMYTHNKSNYHYCNKCGAGTHLYDVEIGDLKTISELVRNYERRKEE